ncbi:SNF2 domain-containing protein CLASSY 4-like [Solanum dulcamara]|uniref:SNF2 domain-containing protein CLASSY 4-like n=1 Tax=Solanum dulcamara TaxID=45834 RepID=UPI0024859282|nr:SNF2 domain-containing protein CLASSY 4-like [Solanum dulcamara]
MDSGDASSVPKRRTRQQFLKYCVELIDKRNKLTQNGNTNHSSTTCSVNIEEDDVSCERKRIKVEEKNTSCDGGDKTKMEKWSEDARMVRSLEKGKKKVDNGKRKFSPGTCESKSITKRPFIQEISDSDDDDDDSEEEESGPDPDDVIIGKVAADSIVNTGSGSGSWSNVGSFGLRSPTLNAADDFISSTSSMSRTTSPSEQRKSEEPIDHEKSEDFVDPSKSQQEFTDTTESSQSESEASSDEDDDDPEDKDYRVHELSSSSQSEDIKSDFDDDYDGRKETKKDDLRSDYIGSGFDNDYDGRMESEDDDLSSPTKQKNNEKGKKESNGRLLPQLAVESEKHRGRTYLLRPRSLPKSIKKRSNHGSCNSPVLLSDDEGSKSSSEEDCQADESVQNAVVQKDQKDVVRKDRKTQKKILKDSEFLRFVVDSIINGDDNDKLTSPEERRQEPVKETLPLIFRFEDEEPLPPEKQEWQKEIEDLFAEMDVCTLESCIGFTNPSVLPMQGSKVSGCQMGNHHLVLDEQIGLICKVCSHVHLEIKYIFPPFAERTRGRYGRKYFGDSSSLLDVDGFRFYDSSAVHNSAIYMEGTVWDLVPMNAKATMYRHQREGFEFMWKNIAGDIILEKLREPLSGSRGGCIISHPPGTGKTRLTIVFLQAFLKQFPKCRPVIVAPSNLLLNWEAEFQKWEVDIPFHNLNSKDFTFQEDEATVSVFHCLSHAGKRDPQLIRMVKLRSWAKSKSVLGISYDLFRILTGEAGDGYAKEIREILLKLPGLLVLEEGHTARNEQSLMWQALNKVETEKRILLSGTPFQNNIKELYNTLCVVSPKFAADLEQKWTSLSSSIDKNVRALEELRDMIAPLVHRCSENVKKESLPGIRDTVIHLKPTDLQKELFKRFPKNPGSFYKQNVVSLISVHPSLVANRSEFCDLESQLKERGCRLDPNAGVKMKFVIELIRLCDGLKERVIIFSQLLDPLNLIKEQLNSLFDWTIGREILYMDGKLDVKQRQMSINSLNDPKSDVKVLLASIKACSEGISLVGASRVVLLDVLWNPSVEQQAISRAYRNGQTRVVHVYCPVTSKWEVDKIEQQTRKRYHSDVLLSRNEVNTCQTNPSCSLSDDYILEAMVQHESLRHIFEKLSHAPRVVPTTCFHAR